MDCCPGQTVIRVKKKFIHENIIYFYNHVSGLRHMQHVQYIHYTVTVHSEDTCWWTYTNSWQWKKNGKKNLKKTPQNKTTRSTLQLSSNTAASCDINLFTQASFWFYIWQKVSDCCSTGETDSACYLHDAKCHSTIFQLSTQHITRAVHTNTNFPGELPTTILNLHNPFRHFLHESKLMLSRVCKFL